MRVSPATGVVWTEEHQARTVAVNAAARWVTIGVELVLGFLMLPFNTRYLGPDDYGLWMLAASIVAYFPVLDLGYAGALDRFIAHYRARRDARAINEIASTLFFVFAACGAVALAIVALVAFNIGTLFELEGGQVDTGRTIMLLIGLQFTLGLPFATFGGVVNGFQRTYLNGIVGIAVSVAVALVNVAVLMAGGTLVQLVAAMTDTRLLGYLWYRLNGYLVFPLLEIRPSLFRMERLREVSRFSVYILIQTLAQKVNYATDPVVIGAFLSTAAVAVWTVAQRLAYIVLRLTNQLNEVLFPVVVDCDSTQRTERLRELLVQGTRISVALVMPIAGALALLAEPVVVGWTGPEFADAAVVLQLLIVVVLVRVGTSTADTVLKGGGHHRLLAWSNTAAATANIVLSILLLHVFGLPGVALATLLPIAVRAVVVVLPVACARVDLPLRAFVGQALWPTAWPAVVALLPLWMVRESVPASLLVAIACGAASALVYAALFVGVAIDRDDRRLYAAKLRSIAGMPRLEPASP
jgi:O-antigen/teichoic acid export membrane protein